MDDTKISHVDAQVVTDIIKEIERCFEKMTVTRGDEHVFLGMSINYVKKNGTAEIMMREYLEESITELGLEINRTAASPAKRDLFEVDDGACLLEKHAADAFHRVTAKLLYVSLRACGDLLTAVGFLSTRVSRSTTQDQAKLKRLLEYINGTLHYRYVLGADDLRKLRTWVDASYAVHPDMKSHTGGIMSFETGGIMCELTKQKLNTNSSTAAEVVGASDYLPNTIWTKMFLVVQGCMLEENTFLQDNESAMRQVREERTHVCRAKVETHPHSVLQDQGQHEGQQDRYPTLPYGGDAC